MVHRRTCVALWSLGHLWLALAIPTVLHKVRMCGVVWALWLVDGRESLLARQGCTEWCVACDIGVRIWLILPVVICFVQGLSHACLSAHGSTVGL